MEHPGAFWSVLSRNQLYGPGIQERNQMLGELAIQAQAVLTCSLTPVKPILRSSAFELGAGAH